MNAYIKTVSDADEIHRMKSEWDSLVHESSGNPFLLADLATSFILLSNAGGWNPMIVTLSSESKLLGFAPLMEKKARGLRLAKFILRPAYSPDLVISSEKRSIYAPLIIDYVLNHRGYHLLSLDLKVGSPYLQDIKRGCKRSGLHYSVISENGHRVLSVRSTWQDFEKHKGGKFRRKFRKIEHNLDKIGAWKIVCANRDDAFTEVLSKILEVEKESWKETWRAQKRLSVDAVLLAILEGLKNAVQTQLDLDWTIWFLEMNGLPIAYTLIILYSGVAYVTKTSYNARYRRFYPGIYINHAAIRQLWDTKKVKLVDFLTDLPFMETWTDNVEGRIKMVISKNPILPLLFGSLLQNNYIKKTVGAVVKPILERISELADF
jgi:CelD/BcsL family acetyltransferase involved in cellulose biosynthesis